MKEMKSWGDLSKHYGMVLFNQCITIEDGAVHMEWMESHNCEAMRGEIHLQDCEIEECKECKEIAQDYGKIPFVNVGLCNGTP